MTICLLGDFSDNLDEGFKNTSHFLAQALSQRNEVSRLNVKQIKTIDFWRELRQCQPSIFHIIAQPTDYSFMFAYLVKKRFPQIKTVISALRVEKYFVDGIVQPWQHFLIKKAKPDLICVQNKLGESSFQRLGCNVAHVPNGVDLDRFCPVTAVHRQALRIRYGLDTARPVVLHVGHLEAARNLKILAPLVETGIQVVIAGSLYMGTNSNLIDELEAAGFYLFKGFQPQIEELYQLADCYVFPPQPGDSLSMPLSVLEAMACNLPVVTMRFSGLESAFIPGRGLILVDKPEQMLRQVQQMIYSPHTVQTRQMVSPYSWQAIAGLLMDHYQALTTDKQKMLRLETGD